MPPRDPTAAKGSRRGPKVPTKNRGRLGTALRRERLRRDLLQSEAALEIHTSQSRYCRMETGKEKPSSGLLHFQIAWWWANGREGACPVCKRKGD